MCIDVFSMLKCNPSMCCRWAWQTPLWLWGAELVPKLAPRLESTWAIYSAAQRSQNCCFNSDKGILILSRSIYPPQRSFSSPAHHRHVTGGKALSWSLFPWWFWADLGWDPFQCTLGKADVSTYPSSPKSNFSADQFLHKIKLQEFRAQLKIAE